MGLDAEDVALGAHTAGSLTGATAGRALQVEDALAHRWEHALGVQDARENNAIVGVHLARGIARDGGIGAHIAACCIACDEGIAAARIAA